MLLKKIVDSLILAKNYLANLFKHLPNTKHIKGFAPDIVGLSIIVIVVALVYAATPSSSVETKKINLTNQSSNSSHSKSTKTKPKIVASVKPATTPSTTQVVTPTVTNRTAPAPTPAPAPHIVVPSPSSSVSSLAPSSSQSSSGNSGGGSPAPAPTVYTSLNWAGYMSATGKYDSISASWIAPSATGTSGITSADATWIGIGGITTGDLIQVGTSNIVYSNGAVATSAFYELLPASSTTISSLPVSPGDSMTASINEVSTNVWEIEIKDNTSNLTFSVQVNYDSSLSSAEWIEEEPSYTSRSLIPLDNFSPAYFIDALTNLNGSSVDLNGAAADEIILENNAGQAKATPSIIGSDGGSFSVTRNSAN